MCYFLIYSANKNQMSVNLALIFIYFYQVVDKPAPVRISSLLTSRHLSQRRMRLPARKYHTKNDGPKVRMMLQLKINLGFE
jgi:hypothetical protein